MYLEEGEKTIKWPTVLLFYTWTDVYNRHYNALAKQNSILDESGIYVNVQVCLGLGLVTVREGLLPLE